jgi:DNA-binding transcriptional regulator YdaS (Cro superfamily)
MRKSTVLKHYKTGAAVARDLGITEAAVSQWGEIIPVMAAHQISELNPNVEELRFNPRLYRHSSQRSQRIAAALSA